MRSSLRPAYRVHPRRPGLLLSLVCIWLALLSVSLTHAAETASSSDLAAQVWQYLTTQDSEQANS
ncbi:MAG TPA: hypothetical protein PKL59_18835, partial [Nitrospira sp.]|nr:hypothetical protein [Nitrospira sp.]